MNLEMLDARIRHEHEQWHSAYAAALRKVEAADREAFVDPEFQRWLWTGADDAIGIGQGNSVRIAPEAFTDDHLVEQLWSVRTSRPESGEPRRSADLAKVFAEILDYVREQHARRRPKARLVRIFALLRPAEVTCMVWDERLRRVLRRLNAGRPPRDTIRRHGAILRLLDERLQPQAEADVDALAWRSILGWQLSTEEPDEEAASGEKEDKLVVRPASAQLKGLVGLSGGLELLRDLLRRVEPGISRQELADELRADKQWGQWSNNTIQSRITLLKTLGLAEKRDGDLHCTPDGLEFLDGADPADILAPFLIQRVFGFAAMLDHLGADPQPTKDLVAWLQDLYPAWSTDFAPRVMVTWAKVLDLLEAPERAQIALTETGEEWAARLPPTEVILERARQITEPGEDDPDFDTEIEADLDPGPQAASTTGEGLRRVPLDEFDNLFAEAGGDALILDPHMLPVVHAALNATPKKRFVVLGGLSGTGKTSFARAYAQAMCTAVGAEPAHRYRCFVAVRPDWTDPTGLLGFPILIADPPRWHMTPALDLLRRAVRAPDKPFFLILEEMNLARVEHYLAPLLTAMENPESGLRLHGEPDNIDGVPPVIPWPRNLFIIGTVNMDATTYAFSDKVLDRAFVWETNTIELGAWRDRRAQETPPYLDEVASLLAAFYEPLSKCRRHFGYRVCDEVLGFCEAAGNAATATLDAAVFSKILPRLRGAEGSGLDEAIKALSAICSARGLVRSGGKLEQMDAELDVTGLVRFWS